LSNNRKTKIKQPSPYTQLKKWFYDKEELENIDLTKISLKYVLNMFGNLHDITMYLNQYNTFLLYKFDKEDFLKELKEIVKKRNIKYKDFSFYKEYKQKDTNKKYLETFPLLKTYEIELLNQRTGVNDESNRS